MLKLPSPNLLATKFKNKGDLQRNGVEKLFIEREMCRSSEHSLHLLSLKSSSRRASPLNVNVYQFHFTAVEGFQKRFQLFRSSLVDLNDAEDGGFTDNTLSVVSGS